jgi:hypothetical protein
VIDHPSGGFETVRAQRNATQRNATTFLYFFPCFVLVQDFARPGLMGV